MTGMLSYQATFVPHLGQRDGGETMDWSSGSLKMQTLRKLPMTAPKRAPITPVVSVSLTRHLVEENTGGDRHVERLRPPPERNADPPMGPRSECRTDSGPLVAD